MKARKLLPIALLIAGCGNQPKTVDPYGCWQLESVADAAYCIADIEASTCGLVGLGDNFTGERPANNRGVPYDAVLAHGNCYSVACAYEDATGCIWIYGDYDGDGDVDLLDFAMATDAASRRWEVREAVTFVNSK